jgi:phosphate transport system substrate-binding protein
MSRRTPVSVFLGIFLACSLVAWGQDPDLRIAGTLSTKPLLTVLARVMKDTKGLRVAISNAVVSTDGIDAVATGKVDIALITKPLTGEDRSQYPEMELVTVPIGMEVVALGVSNDLWDTGVKTVTKETMRKIYEQKITNWHTADGPDEKVRLFNMEQGQGVWEIFAEWLYGDNRKAALPKIDKVATNEDARDALEFTPGAIAALASPLVDGSRCHALAIDLGEHLAKPTPEDVASGAYPMVRPIIAVLVGRPALATRAVTDYLTGPDGQALVRKTGNMGLDAVPKPPPAPY